MLEQRGQQGATYSFTCKKEMFQDGKNIEKHLRFDNNGNPGGSADNS